MKYIQVMIGVSLALICNSLFAHVEPGIKGHSRGDVIGVRTDDEIAKWCDFEKQIVVTQMYTLCVYNGNKESSSPLDS